MEKAKTKKYVPNKANRVKKTYDRASFQTFLIVWVVFCTIFSLLSLLITFLSAMKSNFEIQKDIFSLPGKDVINVIANNFSKAWIEVKDKLFRSIIISLIGAALDCIFGSVLAYIFTYKNIYFKEVIFTVFIAVMLLPSIMGMPVLVPFMKNKLHLGDTIVGYLLPMLAGGQVTALFLFRTFFGQQPKALYENAQVEGANDFKIFFKITLPLAFPIIMYKFVGTFSSLYNDYLWASLILSDNITLMPHIKVAATWFTQYGELGAMYAMYVISSAPLIVTSIISMKYFSSGDFAAGMKL